MEKFNVLLASDPLEKKKKKNRWKAVISTERRKLWNTTVSKYINYPSRKKLSLGENTKNPHPRVLIKELEPVTEPRLPREA